MIRNAVMVCAVSLVCFVAEAQSPFDFKLPGESKKPEQPKAAPAAPAETPAPAAQTPPAPAPPATPQAAAPQPAPAAAVTPAPMPAPAAGAGDRYAVVYGNRIHYIEAGSGPVLVLLHGMGSSTAEWNAVIAPLAKNHRVIAIDQLGHGGSDKPPVAYRVGTLVDFLDGFLRAVNIERATIAGNSLGGWVAASFALEHPAQVERLILIDAGGFALPAGSSLRFVFPSTRNGVRELLAMRFADPKYWTDEAVDAEFTRIMTSGSGMAAERLAESTARGEDVLDGRLGTLRVPTLILWGKEDRIITMNTAQRLNQEIAGSKLVVIDEAGHKPQIEQPAAVVKAIEEFLK